MVYGARFTHQTNDFGKISTVLGIQYKTMDVQAKKEVSVVTILE